MVYWILSLLTLALSIVTPTHAACALTAKGDAGCNGVIDTVDFEIFRKEYTGQLSSRTADFNGDGSVSMVDFEVWRINFFAQSHASPTPSVPTPTSGAQAGVWISHDQLMKLPMSGPAWTALKQVADSDIGTPNMSDQNSPNPERTWGTALVAARTAVETYRTKAVQSLVGVIGTEKNPDPDCASPALGARGLAVGRNLVAYVLAADVLNFRTGGYDPNGQGTKFQQWVDSIRHRKNCDNNGAAALSGDISEGHDGACSNGNSMAGASRIAAAAYLGDKAEVDKAWLTFQRYAGNTTVGPALSINSKYAKGNSPWHVSDDALLRGVDYQ